MQRRSLTRITLVSAIGIVAIAGFLMVLLRINRSWVLPFEGAGPSFFIAAASGGLIVVLLAVFIFLKGKEREKESN